MRRFVAQFLHNSLNLLYPNCCLICDARETELARFRYGLCSDCYRSVTTDPFGACPRCAKTIGPHTDTTRGCVACRGESLGFESAVRLGPYAGRLREGVLRMKSFAGEGLADLLGRIFAECRGEVLRSTGVDLVTAVPLHWMRRWSRGYNQAEAVARELALGQGVPFVPKVIRRTRWTPQQLQPTREARRENVKGAFQSKPSATLSGKTVLVVDDVMTTGSTLSEVARTLRGAGAERVVVAVLART